MLIVCIILFHPINYAIIMDFFRPIDILSIILIIFTLKKWKLDITELFLWITFFVLIFFSSFLGLQVTSFLDLENGLGFLYKFFFIYAFKNSLFAIEPDKKQLEMIYNLWYTVYYILMIWVFIYIYLVSNKLLAGSFQPSFPFSNDYQYSDAHLYSNYLSLSFIFFHFTRNFFKFPKIIRLIELILIFPSIFLTGSRNGVLLILLSLPAIIILNFKDMRYLSKELLFFGAAFIISFILFLHISGDSRLLIERAFSFTLDSSVLGRVRKFQLAVQEASNSLYLFGVGLFSKQGIWYDGIHSQIIATGGILSLLIFFLLFLYYWRKGVNSFRRKKIYYLFSLLLFLYFISNLITEWALVSRSLIPFLFYVFILINIEKLEDIM